MRLGTEPSWAPRGPGLVLCGERGDSGHAEPAAHTDPHRGAGRHAGCAPPDGSSSEGSGSREAVDRVHSATAPPVPVGGGQRVVEMVHDYRRALTPVRFPR